MMCWNFLSFVFSFFNILFFTPGLVPNFYSWIFWIAFCLEYFVRFSNWRVSSNNILDTNAIKVWIEIKRKKLIFCVQLSIWYCFFMFLVPNHYFWMCWATLCKYYILQIGFSSCASYLELKFDFWLHWDCNIAAFCFRVPLFQKVQKIFSPLPSLVPLTHIFCGSYQQL